MKLKKILDGMVNLKEKSKFIGILTTLISEGSSCLALTKEAESSEFVDAFSDQCINKGYKDFLVRVIRDDIVLGIVVDIIIRDGNCIISRDWFQILFQKELQELENQKKQFASLLDGGSKDISTERLRDYRIYHACVVQAYINDRERNPKALENISLDEKSVLFELKKQLELSSSESRCLYLIATKQNLISTFNIDEIIKNIHESGLGFYSRKEMTLYIPDEIIGILREITNQLLPKKYLRRILRGLDDKTLNRICRKHGIKSIGIDEKIKSILAQGIDIIQLLRNDIYEEELSENDRKKVLQEIIEEKLEIHLERTGRTLDEKIMILFQYFITDEKDENISISPDGFDSLLRELESTSLTAEGKDRKPLLEYFKNEFELEPKQLLSGKILLDYAIKPKDVLYALPIDGLKAFCSDKEISYRGKNIVSQILEHYSDEKSRLIENYVFIAKHDMNILKNNGIPFSEKEIGVKFEEVTKSILEKLNLKVNEGRREDSKKTKPDIIIEFEGEGIFIVECKTSRSDYSKFTSVTRQIGSYINYYKRLGDNVLGAILIACDFGSDFIDECRTFTDYRFSLIEAGTLKNIYDTFKLTSSFVFPSTLFRNGLEDEKIFISALKKLNPNN